MGFLSSWFGSGKNADDQGRYITARDFEKILKLQKRLSPQTVNRLRDYGVKPNDSLPLEYFFYTNDEQKALSLAAALRDLGYKDIDVAPRQEEELLFLVTGWTLPIVMDDKTVAAWTEDMVRLGYTHDAEFDGWGTNP